MDERRIRPIFLAGFLSAVIAPGIAAQDLAVALQACRTVQDDAERLACYDREIETRRQPPTTNAPAQAAVPAAASLTPEQRFGYEDVRDRERRDQGPDGTRALEELVAKVAGIAKRPDGALLITLENGQVWRQSTPESYFRLGVGDTVRIKPAALGSFLLYANSRRSIRVTRLR
jgi:hypothetical protein